MGTMEKLCAVYEIHNQVTDTRYIGSSADVWKRIKANLYRLKRGTNHNDPLQAAWNHDGETAFTFRVIRVVAPGCRIQEEAKEMCKYNPSILYNKTSATHILGSRVGHINSDSHRQRISHSLRTGGNARGRVGPNTWADRAVATRIANYTRVIVASHLDGRVVEFSHEAAAARELGFKRKTISEILRHPGRRSRCGWAFTFVKKGV